MLHCTLYWVEKGKYRLVLKLIVDWVKMKVHTPHLPSSNAAKTWRLWANLWQQLGKRELLPQKLKIAEDLTYILWLHHRDPVNDELEFLSIFGCRGKKRMMWKTQRQRHLGSNTEKATSHQTGQEQKYHIVFNVTFLCSMSVKHSSFCSLYILCNLAHIVFLLMQHCELTRSGTNKANSILFYSILELSCLFLLLYQLMLAAQTWARCFFVARHWYSGMSRQERGRQRTEHPRRLKPEQLQT